MKLSELFNDDNVVVGVEARPKNEFLRTIVSDLDSKGYVNDVELATRDVIERENVMSTGVGNGVAIPHAYTDGVDRLVAGFYRSTEGVDFDALDSQIVNLFFIILGPKESRRDHIKILAKISRLLNHEDFREDLKTASDANAVMNVFRRFGDK
ncbi:MAG: PTS sugar transporter subunit IIA [Candidatus Krumholzibacteriota bacterium]|nr:PTS sugar transporter subunit IIA [Candidatus Krumholzibacteriota bacterium]